MAIRDFFSYSDRWDSVGIDCSYCAHFVGPASWPDKERMSHCAFHKVSLAIELRESGYKEGEWFCKEFKNNDKRTNPKALQEFENIRGQLDFQKLYGAYGKEGNLKEFDFKDFNPDIQ